jgi:hypothetical protein
MWYQCRPAVCGKSILGSGRDPFGLGFTTQRDARSRGMEAYRLASSCEPVCHRWCQ